MLPDHISVSQIRCFLDCPRKFRFRYVDHAPPERRSVHLAFGIAVHATIAFWLEERRDGRDGGLDRALRTFRADWASELSDPLVDLEGKDSAALGALGASLVSLFVQRFAEEPVVQIEERVEATLVDTATGGTVPVPLVGYLDFAGDGWIAEVKTVSRKTSPFEWSLQLAAYSYAVRERTGVRPRVRVIELVKTGEPRILVEELTLGDRDEAWFVEVASEVHAAANNNAFFPSPSFRCTTCEYRRRCRR